MKERETVTTREEIDLVETTTVSYGGNNDDTQAQTNNNADSFSNTDSSLGDDAHRSPVSERPSEAARLEANVRREERLIKCYSETINEGATGAAGAEAEALREEENTLLYEDDIISYMHEQQNHSDALAEEEQAIRVEESVLEYQKDVRAYSRSIERRSKANETEPNDSSTAAGGTTAGNEGLDKNSTRDLDGGESSNTDAPPPETETGGTSSTFSEDTKEDGTSETTVTAETEEEISEAIVEELEEEMRETAPEPARKKTPRRVTKRQTSPKKK